MRKEYDGNNDTSKRDEIQPKATARIAFLHYFHTRALQQLVYCRLPLTATCHFVPYCLHKKLHEENERRIGYIYSTWFVYRCGRIENPKFVNGVNGQDPFHHKREEVTDVRAKESYGGTWWWIAGRSVEQNVNSIQRTAPYLRCSDAMSFV